MATSRPFIPKFSMSRARTVLLLGASGLVGGHALRLLARDERWARVVTLGRRAMARASPTHEPHTVNFRDLDAHAGLFTCDAVACCLGTTIKTAGSREAFRFVDLDLPLEAARLARARGAGAFALVSAYGADPDSRIFYNRIKGEAERAVRGVGFERVVLLRPSLLTGERAEGRTGEQIGGAVLRVLRPLLVGPLRNLRPTPAEDVALALSDALTAPEAHPAGAHPAGASGVTVLEPAAIRDRAAELRAARGA